MTFPSPLRIQMPKSGTKARPISETGKKNAAANSDVNVASTPIFNFFIIPLPKSLLLLSLFGTRAHIGVFADSRNDSDE